MAGMDRPRRLPDFIIGGAMKSGTTSIHHLLGAHPDVFIPDRELFFFDADDVAQHPQLLRRGFVLPDYDAELDSRLDQYSGWFTGATDGQLVGEDTTTYLASEKAPRRIAELLPGVKLIFVLRDPVDRAYSHYWHLVRHGLAFFDFDTTLEHMPGTIVQRGLYQAQLERYFSLVSRDRIHVVLFEEFRASPRGAVEKLRAFLGLSPVAPVSSPGQERYNAATAVRFPRLFRNVNLVHRGALGHSDMGQTPMSPMVAAAAPDRSSRSRRMRSLLFDAEASYPPLDPDARERIGRFYARENSGLAELLGRDPADLWPVACP
jgi:hypothetical protein